MNRNEFISIFSLHLFDGGEGSPAAAAAGNTDVGAQDPAGAGDAFDASTGLDGDDPSTGTDAASAEDPKERAKRYKQFREEFRPELNEERNRTMKKELSRRLRGKEKIENELRQANETLDYARKLFGAKDLAELDQKLRSDSMVKSRRAAELGLSDEAYDRYVELELKAEAADNERKAREMSAATAELDAAEEALREEFPDLDIDELRKNDDFVSMLKSGVPMRHAYMVLNQDKVIEQETSKRVAAALEAQRQRRSRPQENAGGGKSGRSTRDITKLTTKECEDMERRAMRGERIIL